MKERDLQKLILDWLRLHHIFHWRNNTGAFAVAATENWQRRFVRYGTLGAPDIFAMRAIADGGTFVGADVYGIEVKGPKGEQSEVQKKFEEEFTRAGGEYILARSLEDVSRVLE